MSQNRGGFELVLRGRPPAHLKRSHMYFEPSPPRKRSNIFEADTDDIEELEPNVTGGSGQMQSRRGVGSGDFGEGESQQSSGGGFEPRLTESDYRSGCRGVSWNRRMKSWLAFWTENKTRRSKTFNAKVLGFDEAREAAIEFLQNKRLALQAQAQTETEQIQRHARLLSSNNSQFASSSPEQYQSYYSQQQQHEQHQQQPTSSQQQQVSSASSAQHHGHHGASGSGSAHHENTPFAMKILVSRLSCVFTDSPPVYIQDMDAVVQALQETIQSALSLSGALQGDPASSINPQILAAAEDVTRMAGKALFALNAVNAAKATSAASTAAHVTHASFAHAQLVGTFLLPLRRSNQIQQIQKFI